MPSPLLMITSTGMDSLAAGSTAAAVNKFAKEGFRARVDLPDPVPLSDNLKVACEQQAIPNREAVDKMIRYEAAAERNLSKALDRLEILQRRRRGEAPPRRLNVNVS